MTTVNVSLTELLLKVMNEHQAKVGMSTCLSELGYIEEAAKLQGYGQESFPAKVSQTCFNNFWAPLPSKKKKYMISYKTMLSINILLIILYSLILFFFGGGVSLKGLLA